MPLALRLTASGDLDVTNGFQFVGQGDQIIQRVRRELRFVRGEWKIDLSRGFPYYEDVFQKAPTIAAIQNVFARRLERIPGVTGVEQVTLRTDRLAQGELVVDFEVTTREGVISGTDTTTLESVIAGSR